MENAIRRMDCSKRVIRKVVSHVCAFKNSKSSLSKYIHAECGYRNVIIRVSDHPPRDWACCDLSVHPGGNTRVDLVKWLNYGSIV